jgi:beta-glucosidase
VAKGCAIDSEDQSGFKAALDAAAQADVVVLAIGERADMSGEAASRAYITVPGAQEALLTALKATGKPVVVVLMNGRPLTIPNIDRQADAILETWWSGTEAGNAIADVLSGAYNPSGKLTMSFPRTTGQIPVYYNHKSAGRPFDPNSKWTTKYIDEANAPLYAFGYGLSYTSFKYGVSTASKTAFKKGESIVISVELTNTGNVDGEEVAQLYIHDLVGSVTRPVRELKAFQKVMLRKGETKTLTFTLSDKDFSFFKQNMQFGSEPGDFEITVGGNSDTDNVVRVSLK